MRKREACQPLERPSRSLSAVLKEFLPAPSDQLLNSQVLKRAQQLGALDGRHMRAGAAATRKDTRLILVEGQLGCSCETDRLFPNNRS